MPRFVDVDAVQEIQAPWWSEKETCSIKRFTYGDRQFLASNTIQMGLKIEDMSAITDVLVGRMNLAILERGIASWTDAKGVKLPVTKGKISRLEEKDAEFILAAITELNPSESRSAEEQETFPGADGNSAEE